MRSRSLASPTLQHVPMIAHEAGRDVLAEGEAGVAFDRDMVVVVDPAEVVERQMSGERGRLRADALHQAAVAADRIDVIVEDVELRLVVAAGEPFLGDRHADAGGDALAQRPGGGFDARDPMVFRMPRRLAVDLAKAADLVERDRRLAEPLIVGVHRLRLRQIQHRPDQHRGVAVRQHETIAIGPDRILRVEAHDPVPDRVDERRQRHRRAGMTGFRLLDGVDRERADRVDRQEVEVLVGHALRPPVRFSSPSSAASRGARRTHSAWPTASCPQTALRRGN